MSEHEEKKNFVPGATTGLLSSIDMMLIEEGKSLYVRR
jgi:hypothetical protein